MALSVNASAYFILAASSWMQHPVGTHDDPETGLPLLRVTRRREDPHMTSRKPIATTWPSSSATHEKSVSLPGIAAHS